MQPITDPIEAAHRVLSIFYGSVKRGRNIMAKSEVSKAYRNANGEDGSCELGLDHCAKEGWLLQQDATYEITQAGCFDLDYM